MSDYQKGYAAGRKKTEEDIKKEKENLYLLNNLQSSKKERVYLSCLNMVLKNCTNWSINGKQVKDAEGYCQLAKIFYDNSIKILKDNHD